ncbi:MAG: ParB/RepB/Spo0J family partition protein [Geminicoccaceae bacterium]
MPAHKRRLSAALLNMETPEDKPVSSGRGGAWRAGLHADTQHDLNDLKAKQAQDIANGDRAISLEPGQVRDLVGTDRRADWQDQEDYIELRDSIEKYGQDVPIEICPIDPDWQPSSANPTDVDGVEFELITGRRRRAVAEDLGIDVRAVILPKDDQDQLHQWQVLLRRYRENNHRSNLSPLEKMLSVGEMYEAWSKTSGQASIRQFAGLIGIDASFVSRSNRLSKHERALKAAFPDPYKLGYRELESWITGLSGDTSLPKRVRASAPKGMKIDVRGHRVEWKRKKDSLVLTIGGVNADPDTEELKKLVENFVTKLTS